jgi:hypothetical protein
MLLILILIVLLFTLIIFQLYGAFIRFLKYLGLRMRERVEGFTDSKTYTDPGLNKDSLYLSTINAANISYLKERVDKLNELNKQLSDLNGRVDGLSKKVDTTSTAASAIGDQLTLTSQEVIGRSVDSTEPLPMATGLA